MHRPETTDSNDSMVSQLNSYWNEAYEKLELPQVPSQFAAFVANEISEYSTIIDLGCGNGKDVIFFASLGFKTIGVDASISAIKICNDKRATLTYSKNLEFIHSDLNEYLYKMDIPNQSPVCFYSRFVYHSLDEVQSVRFLQLLAKCISKSNGVAYLEFRSSADKHGEKVTPDHFRRLETLETFSTKCNHQGLTLSYAVEGQGFAKWMHDDAIVIRAVIATG